ncbi:16S rRNA (uracil(1498)-N(3))-methyltransferase [bacterium]|nr:16S rRNA (uracil(1498)-N(3))-methyltransferase [bacterium]
MKRIFLDVDTIRQGELINLAQNRFHYLIDVLRLKTGDSILIVDKINNVWEALIEDVGDKCLKLRIIVLLKEENKELPAKICLYQSVLKNKNTDLVIQKATELGVFEIHPIITRRSVAIPKEDRSKKQVERWQKIAEGASEQSGRIVVPKVFDLMSIGDSLRALPEGCFCIVPWEEENKINIKSIFRKKSTNDPIAVFIGPEGGFDYEEVKAIRDLGGISVSLGARILRSETAAIYLMSVLNYELVKGIGCD